MGEITVGLEYRPPYRWNEMLDFLRLRTIPSVEHVTETAYMRTVRLHDSNGESALGYVRVTHSPQNQLLGVAVSESLLPVFTEVLARVKGLFDLDCNPEEVHQIVGQLNATHPDAFKLGLRLPGAFDAFEMAARAILGQQVSVRAARVFCERIANIYGHPVDTGMEQLTRSFPLAQDIVAMGDEVTENLGRLGVISVRSQAIFGLAQRFVSGDLNLSPFADPESEIRKLKSIRGIGDWTAQYIAMRTMEWPDAFLPTDAAIKKALPGLTTKEMLTMADQWRPWRSYATIGLWNSLE